jgi:hypothetical protein
MHGLVPRPRPSRIGIDLILELEGSTANVVPQNGTEMLTNLRQSCHFLSLDSRFERLLSPWAQTSVGNVKQTRRKRAHWRGLGRARAMGIVVGALQDGLALSRMSPAACFG